MEFPENQKPDQAKEESIQKLLEDRRKKRKIIFFERVLRLIVLIAKTVL